MCGGYTCQGSYQDIQLIPGLDFPDCGPFWNIHPLHNVPIVRASSGTVEIAEVRWWLVPHWAKEATTKYPS